MRPLCFFYISDLSCCGSERRVAPPTRYFSECSRAAGQKHQNDVKISVNDPSFLFVK